MDFSFLFLISKVQRRYQIETNGTISRSILVYKFSFRVARGEIFLSRCSKKRRYPCKTLPERESANRLDMAVNRNKFIRKRWERFSSVSRYLDDEQGAGEFEFERRRDRDHCTTGTTEPRFLSITIK